MSFEVTVTRGEWENRSNETVVVAEGADGWYVMTPVDSGYWRFADAGTSKGTIAQLVRKKWDSKYGDPDAFTDRD
jgi:hypothetical protein